MSGGRLKREKSVVVESVSRFGSYNMTSSGEYPSTVLQRRARREESIRGDAIFISMEKYPQGRERHGAEVDRGRMETLFRTLFFGVKCYIDYTAEDLRTDLKKIAEYKPEETRDCFVCFVSAHGNVDEDGHYITDTKGSKIYIIDDILKPFMKCRNLLGVPKVFFINACRGEHLNKQDLSTERLMEYIKESGKDSLVVFSTEEGNESARSPRDGTLFVQALHEVILMNHQKEDVVSMVTIANKMLRKEISPRVLRGQKDKPRCQISPSHFNLTGKLYWRTRDPSEGSADQKKYLENVIVGQDGHREKLKKWLMSRSNDTGGTQSHSFGISGTGGIGKTTLAKSLYEDEDIKDYYDHRVYWVTINKTPDIVKCQRRLFSEICKETPSASLDTEKLLLKELKIKLSEKKRVLLFLDDVWKKNDLDRLLGESFLETLPRGSKCILTSRKRAELAELDANAQIVELDVLSNSDARKLFCSKAFLNEEIPHFIQEDLREVVEKVIDACGNMPILLTTLGANRWGIRSIESWEDVLHRLKGIMAENGDIDDDESADYQRLIKQLRISYDDLPEGDPEPGDGVNFKDYFLDFAAFPEREEIEIAMLMDMWTKPGLTEDEAYEILEELEQRCLVKIVGYWCYVHDIFRALAIKIVEQEPLKKRKRLFAWGISNSRLPEKWDLPQNVRSEECEDDLREEAVIFETEKMVIARSELKEFHPRDSILFTCLTRLRMLLLTSNLNLVSLPSAIGCMKSLEKLDLSWCLGLKVLPAEIGQLENLQKLNMAGCCSLTWIPREVGNLKKLMELNMQSCGIEELPDEIGELTSLVYLSLNDCSELKVLPEAMGKLSNLEMLYCEMLPIREIPKALGDLSKLTYLSFGACGGITGIPAEFVKLKKLTFMCFAACHQLKDVPAELDRLATEGWGSLKEFNVCNAGVVVDRLPPSLHELQGRVDRNSRDSRDGLVAGGDIKLQGIHKRGVLVDPTSVFNPRNEVERRASFGLARIISMVKTEPFLSVRFDAAIRIMYTMANHDGTRHAIVRSGGLPVLLRCIDKGDPQRCGEYAAATLRNICLTYSTHKAVVDAQGLVILTRVLHRKNGIKYYAYQALRLIINGDIEEGDFEFTSEIYDRCGHIYGDRQGRSLCMMPNSDCIYCPIEQEFRNDPAIKAGLKS